jgi:hypothetical protein
MINIRLVKCHVNIPNLGLLSDRPIFGVMESSEANKPISIRESYPATVLTAANRASYRTLLGLGGL